MGIKHTIEIKNGETKKVDLTPVRAIHLYCVLCVGFNSREVSKCSAQKCPLYPYRAGKQPERAGIGGRKT